MDDFPLIVTGTYEEFVLGFKPELQVEKKNKLTFRQVFATHSHQASVRCTAANDKFMASSGADEYINIYDMIHMKVFKVINYHDATVTCLEFTPDKTHLISGNQKGDIAIFRCQDWNLVKLWKEAHKSANGVTSMSVHPTGGLLLTTGADNILRFWNLIKGRQAYATNYSKHLIGSLLNFGAWSVTGKYYVVCTGKQMEIYLTKTAAVVYKVVMNSKITCVAFCKKTLICIGNEEGYLEVHSLVHKKLFGQEQAHKTRLKCMSSFKKAIVKNESHRIETYLVTADSQGLIKLWCLKKKGLRCTLQKKAEINCDCRITCLSIVFPPVIKQESNNTDTEKKNIIHHGKVESSKYDSVKKKNKMKTIIDCKQNGKIKNTASISGHSKILANKSRESNKTFKNKKRKLSLSSAQEIKIQKIN